MLLSMPHSTLSQMEEIAMMPTMKIGENVLGSTSGSLADNVCVIIVGSTGRLQRIESQDKNTKKGHASSDGALRCSQLMLRHTRAWASRENKDPIL
jgi:hypothetical protein